MISLDPSDRPTFDILLHTSRGSVFPESFYSFLHNYVSSVNELSSDALPSHSDHRLDRIWADYESIEPYIMPENVERSEMDVKIEYMRSLISTARPFQVSLIYISMEYHFLTVHDVILGYSSCRASHSQSSVESTRFTTSTTYSY